MASAKREAGSRLLGHGISAQKIFVRSLLVLAVLAAPSYAAAGDQASDAGGEEPFLIRVEEGAPENGVERFQRILVISLPFCTLYSYGICYLAAASEQKDKTPDMSRPRDYKPYMLAGAVALSLTVAIYDCWWRRSSRDDAEGIGAPASRGTGANGWDGPSAGEGQGLKISLVAARF